MEQKDYYQILGLDKDAGQKKIKEAYRKLAFKYHPDRNKERPKSTEKMKRVNEAYAVLSDPGKKREYDTLKQQFGSSAYNQFRKNYSEQDIFSGSDVNQIFEEMAKTFGFRHYDEIFREFYGQKHRSFEFKKHNQTQFPLQEPFGKLYTYVLKKISGIELPEDGADIKDIIHLDPLKAKQGGPYAYSLKKKFKKLVVKIPPGIREGQRIRLSGMGENGKGGGKHGDLYLKVYIKKPLLQKIKDFISHLRK
ncbi:MAG: DnaJ domain-containing protein [Deltaproteobacteria bacterium]|nr:DnaJ domain-containing protein [Deltaproteobacteria bacterium]MBW2661327.1 DnaJ domain-containing protein [Deltaproteobacteria bacterium]